MSIQKYDPEVEKKPSLMKKRRYPVTLVIATILGIPAFFFAVAVAAGESDVSSKFLLIGIVLFFYLGVVGISFIFEGQERRHW